MFNGWPPLSGNFNVMPLENHEKIREFYNEFPVRTLFSDENVGKVLIRMMRINGNFFLINAHGVLRRMGAVTENPGSNIYRKLSILKPGYSLMCFIHVLLLIIHIKSHMNTASNV